MSIQSVTFLTKETLNSIWEKLYSVPDSTLSSVIISLNPDYISPIICHYQLFIPFNAKWKYIKFFKKNYLLNIGTVLTRAVQGFSRHLSPSVCVGIVANKVELENFFLRVLRLTLSV
jgi:hypothetical protein